MKSRSSSKNEGTIIAPKQFGGKIKLSFYATAVFVSELDFLVGDNEIVKVILVKIGQSNSSFTDNSLLFDHYPADKYHVIMKRQTMDLVVKSSVG